MPRVYRRAAADYSARLSRQLLDGRGGLQPRSRSLGTLHHDRPKTAIEGVPRVLAFCWFIFILCGFTRTNTVLETAPDELPCSGCGYDTTGLSELAVCPECGCESPRKRHDRKSSHIETCLPPQRDVLAFAIIMLVFYLVAALPLAREIYAWSYMLDGYAATTSRRAAEVRDLPHAMHSGLMLPFMWMAASLPWASLVNSRRAAWIGVGMIVVFGVLLLPWAQHLARKH